MKKSTRESGRVCAAYIRVSTHDQEEYSPQSQLKLIREYAEKNGFTLPEELVFRDEGISGRTAHKRPGFMEMIAAARVKPRLFGTILVWKFSRFARNQEESVVYKSLLKKENGIEVVSVSEPIAEGPFGGLIERIIEWFDAFYSANLGAEVRRGMAERAGRGLPVSAPPLGYAYRDREFVIVPGEADTVRAIFRDFLNGMPPGAIAGKLNRQGVRTKRGGRWEGRTVRYILRNPVYAGKLRWCKEGANDYHGPALLEGTMIVEGGHEAIVSEEDFREAGRLLERQAGRYKGEGIRRGPASHMLQGILRCGACGGSMSFTGAGMNCVQYVHGRCGSSQFITVEKLEALMLCAVKEQVGGLRVDVLPGRGRKAEEERLAQLLRREEAVLGRYRESYAAGVDSLEEYRANKSAGEARVRELREALEGLGGGGETLHTDAASALTGDGLTARERNALLKELIEGAVLYRGDRRLEVVYYL